MPHSPYNDLPYPTYPRLKTHPDRLAAVGKLFGMDPAPVARCRVLEVGCGNANNLIPMAYTLPESHFTGIDLASEPIEAGRRMAGELDIRNLQLTTTDLRDFRAPAGSFDYIIAHGVYSWVPEGVRDALLRATRELLAPQGIAFISYNVYPGRHMRQMLREMMLYHVRETAEPAARVERARWFLEFLLGARLLAPGWNEVLEGEAKRLLERGPGSIFHDDLAEVNDPVYFHEFAAHARSHKLQYLGEADFHEMFDPKGSLAWLGDDVLEREQYLDFMRLRRFRQTLLCREEVALDRHPAPELMDGFCFSAPARAIEGGQIEGLHGVRISATQEIVSHITSALGETYPLPLSFEELVPYAGDRKPLREILLALVIGGFADLHVYDFPCQDEVTTTPRASRLVRYQAEQGPQITGVCHHVVEVDEMTRRLVTLLDGTRSQDALAAELAAGTTNVSAPQIAGYLPSVLEWLAQQGLLEA